MDEDEEPTTVYVAPSGDLRLLVERTCSISAVNTEIRSPKRKRAESSTSSSPERQQATSTKIFVVSSVVLCFASPVWKAMFDPQGHFMEATNSSTGTKEFRFEGDDPDALLILLQIAHLQFRKLPESLDYERLLNLAILCDKYDTVELIRPWVAKWEWPSKDFANKPGHEEWLFIAWAFGDTSTYEVLAKSLVQSTLSNTSGECLSSSSKLLGINMPPGAIESILEARRITIKALLDACYRLVHQYESDEVVCQARYRWEKCKPDVREECDALVFGSLMKGLKRIGFWPGPVSLDEVHSSVSGVIEKLLSLTCFELGNDDTHSNCKYTYKLAAAVVQINKGVMPSGVDESHRRHMEEQARK